MGIDECVKEVHNHNDILKASQEHPGDEALWRHRGVSPERKDVVQPGTLIAVREGVHPHIQYGKYHRFPQCEIFVQCSPLKPTSNPGREACETLFI